MVTREDVARLAGVSVTVVSRVINEKGYVSQDKKEKVEKAIEELGYRPNLIARSLKTNETKQLLFFAPELVNPFYTEVYKGMEDYAEKHGYTIVVSRHYNDDMVFQRRFDGVILSDFARIPLKQMERSRVPMVVTNYTGEVFHIPSVGINMMEGAFKAVNYLLDQGHRKIGFITNVPAENEQRYCGYLEAIRYRDIEPCSSRIIVEKRIDTAYEQGYRAGIHLVENRMDVTAVFVFNDAMATGVIAALDERGLGIPGDISVMGFDNILQSRYTCPPLTTIHIPKYEQGQESAKMLIQEIRGMEVNTTILETSLIIRKSVGKNYK